MTSIATSFPRRREPKSVSRALADRCLGSRLRGNDVEPGARAAARLLALPILIGAGVLVSTSVALAASSKGDWSYEDCPEKAQARWCAPMMRSGGWQLKYRSTQPEDLPDVFWTIEVWVKGADALVCELKGGKGGIRSNGCYSAVEVPGGK